MPGDTEARLFPGFPSGRFVTLAGIPYITQCTQGSAIGASGSSQISVNSFVPLGAFFHSSGGETSAPSPVYFLAMGFSRAMAGLVMVKLVAASSPLILDFRSTPLEAGCPSERGGFIKQGIIIANQIINIMNHFILHINPSLYMIDNPFIIS
jgi:hypothetical protein